MKTSKIIVCMICLILTSCKTTRDTIRPSENELFIVTSEEADNLMARNNVALVKDKDYIYFVRPGENSQMTYNQSVISYVDDQGYLIIEEETSMSWVSFIGANDSTSTIMRIWVKVYSDSKKCLTWFSNRPQEDSLCSCPY